mmetsp:Transcript_14961/g.27139  ORF Transcript_14961/g.27139 Transcript_14961/m.27139 type:complete len:239 (+) Transcript_14961:517-1233(+)
MRQSSRGKQIRTLQQGGRHMSTGRISTKYEWLFCRGCCIHLVSLLVIISFWQGQEFRIFVLLQPNQRIGYIVQHLIKVGRTMGCQCHQSPQQKQSSSKHAHFESAGLIVIIPAGRWGNEEGQGYGRQGQVPYCAVRADARKRSAMSNADRDAALFRRNVFGPRRIPPRGSRVNDATMPQPRRSHHQNYQRLVARVRIMIIHWLVHVQTLLKRLFTGVIIPSRLCSSRSHSRRHSDVLF